MQSFDSYYDPPDVNVPKGYFIEIDVNMPWPSTGEDMPDTI